MLSRFSVLQRSLLSTQAVTAPQAAAAVLQQTVQPVVVLTKKEKERMHNEMKAKIANDAEILRTVRAAAIVVRYPVITPDKNELEVEWDKFRERIDLEKSKYSVSERWEMAGEKQTQKDDDIFYDANFKPAPRVTQADHDNNRRSLDRKLQTHLYAVVKEKDSNRWTFPMGPPDAKHVSLKEAADLAYKNACGEMKIHFNQNQPWGYLEENGKHIFYFWARRLKSDIQLNFDQYSEYLWVTRDELKDLLDPKVHETVLKFLPPTLPYTDAVLGRY